MINAALNETHGTGWPMKPRHCGASQSQNVEATLEPRTFEMTDTSQPPELPTPLVLKDVPQDLRLYVPYPQNWEVHIQDNGPREYCHYKTPGQDYFHLLLPGEIYVQFGTSKFCLNCAYRFGHLSDDRLHWQNGTRRNRHPLT